MAQTRSPHSKATAKPAAARPDFSPAVEAALARAESHCRARRGSLTDLRKMVLGLIYEHNAPVGAYELIQQLGQLTERTIGPPTVYRALDFLVDMGLITRVVSRNAFVACDHPDVRHQCMFFICRDCGATIELVDAKLDRILSQDAQAIGFTPDQRVVEVKGTCRACGDARAIGAAG
jgi:Fur family zinc uptake transcriptional regulator